MAESNWPTFLRQSQTNTFPMIGSQPDKTAYYNPYPNIISVDKSMRNYMENLYRDKLWEWYPYGTPKLYSNPSDLSHLIGNDDYYWARHVDNSLRYPTEPAVDYYLKYGHKYANRFKYQTRQKLSPQGQKWLDSTLVYLQRMLEDELYINPGIELDKNNFRNFAFGTHPIAYSRAGFYPLSGWDKFHIAMTPDIGDIFSKSSSIQVEKIGEQLIAYKFYPYWYDLYDSWEYIPYSILKKMGVP